MGPIPKISHFECVNIPKLEKNTKSEILLVPSISGKGYVNCNLFIFMFLQFSNVLSGDAFLFYCLDFIEILKSLHWNLWQFWKLLIASFVLSFPFSYSTLLLHLPFQGNLGFPSKSFMSKLLICTLHLLFFCALWIVSSHGISSSLVSSSTLFNLLLKLVSFKI